VSRLREILTPRGIQLVQHGTLISDVSRRPGATHGFFDLLAALIRLFGEQRRIALLGFAGGGLIAPVRAMGLTDMIHAVDVSLDGFRLFRRLCLPWGEPVSWHQADAFAWLRDRPGAFDLVVDDLSVPGPRDILKPEATWAELPGLMHRALVPGGIAVFNLLKPQVGNWTEGLRRVATPFPHVLEIQTDDYENRVLVGAATPLDARAVSRDMRRHLRSVRSRIASRFSVRQASRLVSVSPAMLPSPAHESRTPSLRSTGRFHS